MCGKTCVSSLHWARFMVCIFFIDKYIVCIHNMYICNPCDHVHLNLEADLPSSTTKYMPPEQKILFTLEFTTANYIYHGFC